MVPRISMVRIRPNFVWGTRSMRNPMSGSLMPSTTLDSRNMVATLAGSMPHTSV